MGFLAHLAADQRVVALRVPERNAGGFGEIAVHAHSAAIALLPGSRNSPSRSMYQAAKASTIGSVKGE